MVEFGKTIRNFSSKSGESVSIQVVSESDLQALIDFINNLISEDTYIYRDTDKTVTEVEEKQWLENTMNEMKKGNQFYKRYNSYSQEGCRRRKIH